MTDTISVDEYNALKATAKGNKYSAVKTVVDGITFDSMAESRRYKELKLLRDGGLIRDLVIHPRFEIVVNGVKITRYSADFAYTECATDERVVEDVKGGAATKTRAYVIRRKLMLALHGITIREVTA